MALALLQRQEERRQRLSSAELLASLQKQKSGLSLSLGRQAPAPSPPQPQTLEGTLLLPGSIVELSALPGAGALTLGFMILAAARRRAQALGKTTWLCALDPTGTLSAPAVQCLGVPLDELLVVRAPEDRLLRVGVRAARSGAVCGLLIDATAVLDLSGFVVGLRRLVLAAEELSLCAVLLTSARARRSLPLPCAARALVESVDQQVEVRFVRHPHGVLGHSTSGQTSGQTSGRQSSGQSGQSGQREGSRLRLALPGALVHEALTS